MGWLAVIILHFAPGPHPRRELTPNSSTVSAPVADAYSPLCAPTANSPTSSDRLPAPCGRRRSSFSTLRGAPPPRLSPLAHTRGDDLRTFRLVTAGTSASPAASPPPPALPALPAPPALRVLEQLVLPAAPGLRSPRRQLERRAERDADAGRAWPSSRCDAAPCRGRRSAPAPPGRRAATRSCRCPAGTARSPRRPIVGPPGRSAPRSRPPAARRCSGASAARRLRAAAAGTR